MRMTPGTAHPRPHHSPAGPVGEPTRTASSAPQRHHPAHPSPTQAHPSTNPTPAPPTAPGPYLPTPAPRTPMSSQHPQAEHPAVLTASGGSAVPASPAHHPQRWRHPRRNYGRARHPPPTTSPALKTVASQQDSPHSQRNPPIRSPNYYSPDYPHPAAPTTVPSHHWRRHSTANYPRHPSTAATAPAA